MTQLTLSSGKEIMVEEDPRIVVDRVRQAEASAHIYVSLTRMYADDPGHPKIRIQRRAIETISQ